MTTAEVDQSDAHWQDSTTARFRDSISGRITVTSVAMAIVPVAVVGIVAIVSLMLLASTAEDARSGLAATTVGPSRAEEARLVLDQLDTFVDERVDDVIDWSRASVVVQMADAERAEVDRLATLPIEQVENEMGADHLLDSTGISSQYLLRQIADRPYFAEVFFTDSNGFNVATTNPTSDFVQRDEDWWQTAWDQGAFLGEVEFDESAEVVSFEVALRIDNTLGNPVGVIKSVVNVTALQQFADDFASSSAGDVEVRVMTGAGMLLAETETDHDPRRIGTVAELQGDDDIAQQLALDLTSEQSSLPEGLITEEMLVAEVATVSEDGVNSALRASYALLNEDVVGVSASQPVRTIPRLGIEVPNQQLVSVVALPKDLALAPLAGVTDLESDLDNSVRNLLLTIVLLLLATIVGSVLVARVVGRRIASPIIRLREEADRVANEELPMLIESLSDPEASGDLPEVAPIEIDADGEVAELTQAFNSVRSTATHLAASQAVGRNKDVSAILMSLGRRNQQLVGRQLQFIDQLERTEVNPDTLQNLFQLDQMATRMRRNAESLLVLAGEESRKSGSRPASIDDVIRAAMSAVEDFERVELVSADSVSLLPTVAGDVSHLLAEIIENATSFSPPDTHVEVIGTLVGDGSYTISVVDRGIGMAPAEMEAANEQLRSPRFTDRASASQLGLLVVGRLAARHQISARLVESATTGITAKVTLAAELLASIGSPQFGTPVLDLTDSANGDAQPGLAHTPELAHAEANGNGNGGNGHNGLQPESIASPALAAATQTNMDLLPMESPGMPPAAHRVESTQAGDSSFEYDQGPVSGGATPVNQNQSANDILNEIIGDNYQGKSEVTMDDPPPRRSKPDSSIADDTPPMMLPTSIGPTTNQQQPDPQPSTPAEPQKTEPPAFVSEPEGAFPVRRRQKPQGLDTPPMDTAASGGPAGPTPEGGGERPSTLRVRRRKRQVPADVDDATVVATSDGTTTEVGKARADEVRDKLSSFTEGVGIARRKSQLSNDNSQFRQNTQDQTVAHVEEVASANEQFHAMLSGSGVDDIPTAAITGELPATSRAEAVRSGLMNFNAGMERGRRAAASQPSGNPASGTAGQSGESFTGGDQVDRWLFGPGSDATGSSVRDATSGSESQE